MTTTNTKTELTLREFFETIYQPRRIPTCAPTTRHGYNVLLRHFDRFLGRTALIGDLTEGALGGYIGHRLPGRSTVTIDRERSKLLALANYAHKKGLLAEVPDVATVQIFRRMPQAYKVGEISRLLAAAGKVTGSVAGIPYRLYWPAFILVLYDTGGRQGAAWKLRWEDYRPENCLLLFRAETQKQKTDQLLKITQQTAELLEAIRKPEREEIFPWLLCDNMKYLHFKQILRAAGLPHGRHDMFHKIRRTTATLMHQNGGDACAQLGHSSDAVTRKSYLDLTNSVQAADILPRPGGNGRGEAAPTAAELRKQAMALLAQADGLKQAPAKDSLSYSVCVGIEGGAI